MIARRRVARAAAVRRTSRCGACSANCASNLLLVIADLVDIMDIDVHRYEPDRRSQASIQKRALSASTIRGVEGCRVTTTNSGQSSFGVDWIGLCGAKA